MVCVVGKLFRQELDNFARSNNDVKDRLRSLWRENLNFI